jgi:hypothetical protein
MTGVADRLACGKPFLGEVIATAGLLLVIHLLVAQSHQGLLPLLVPAWIGTARFFTSSTSFANTAVTFGRAWSNTFAGISPGSVIPFMLTQLLGGGIGVGIAQFFKITK